MKRYRIVIPVVFALLLSLTACAPSSPASTKAFGVSSPAAADTSPAAIASPAAVSDTAAHVSAAASASSGSISELIPYLKAPEKIFVFIGHTSQKFFGGKVYAEPNSEQAAQLSALLARINPADFVACDRGFGGVSAALSIKSGTGSCDLTIIKDTNNAHIVFTTDGGEHDGYFRAAPDAVPFIELSKACNAVRADTTDAEKCGLRLSLDGSNATHTLAKADTAKLQNILDGTADYYGPYKGAETYSFDSQVNVGKTVYKLDSKTGIFSLTRDGKTEIFKLEDYLDFCTLMMTGKQPG